jgi:hypothetical protein
MDDLAQGQPIVLGTGDLLFRPDCHDDIPVDIAHAADIVIVEALNNHGVPVSLEIAIGDGRTIAFAACVE